MARPYYVITFTKEYDGYENYIMYVGTNYKAAVERYKKLYDYVRQDNFLNDGIDEERIEDGYRIPPEEPLEIGKKNYSYINDQDCYYVSICLEAVSLHQFTWQNLEERYKRDVPNSKY